MLAYGYSWPEMFECGRFPSSELCIGPVSEHDEAVRGVGGHQGGLGGHHGGHGGHHSGHGGMEEVSAKMKSGEGTEERLREEDEWRNRKRSEKMKQKKKEKKNKKNYKNNKNGHSKHKKHRHGHHNKQQRHHHQHHNKRQHNHHKKHHHHHPHHCKSRKCLSDFNPSPQSLFTY